MGCEAIFIFPEKKKKKKEEEEGQSELVLQLNRAPSVSYRNYLTSPRKKKKILLALAFRRFRAKTQLNLLRERPPLGSRVHRIE